ncbi:hypothetical protein [Inconstantimicrobium mannanitabidum]|uniref:Uncharacterized protein n=1 Tax=Inconstantimicrobium mannanitabidum TaxID=1604901 RepID=A0ACB5RFV8_9CLOT|nr:hypothetical protein [Clostridium sp. TW13]GKX67943.1 hypothetical protein rsdtw13_32010 [Clostridium sp. TW13]
MKCNKCIDLIPAILENDTNSNETKDFFQHIEQCTNCHNEYLYQKQAKEDLRESLELEGFQFYDSTNEILSKIDTNKYLVPHRMDLRKACMFLVKTIVPCMLVMLIAIFLPPMLKDYYNRITPTPAASSNKNADNIKTKDTNVKIINSDALVKCQSFTDLVFFNRQALLTETSNDSKIIDMVNDMLQEKNISLYNRNFTNRRFYDTYNTQSGLMVVLYLKNVTTTTFKVNSKEINIKYDTIKIPLNIYSNTQPLIFFSIRGDINSNDSKNVDSIASLTIKDKETFKKLFDYYNYSYLDHSGASYYLHSGEECFANVIRKVASSSGATMITDSLKNNVVVFNDTAKTSALKYFEVLSKDSGIDRLNENLVGNNMSLHWITLTDKRHGKYNLYAVCYAEQIKYCFIEQDGKYFSINWNTLENLTGKNYNQWLKDNNFPEDTIITQRDANNHDYILTEYYRDNSK